MLREPFFLLAQFGLEGDDLYSVAGPVNLHRLIAIPSQVNRPDLQFPPFAPDHLDNSLQHLSELVA